MKILHLIIFSSFTLLYSDDTLQNKSLPIHEYHDTGYPIIEVTAGFGLFWLLQGNVTISPIRYFYIQPRVSSILLANEAGITFGLQKRYEKDSIIRIGIGFSQGSSTSLDPGGGTERNWNSYYFRMGMLIRRSEDFVYNPNINITATEDDFIFSFNFAIGYCLYR